MSIQRYMAINYKNHITNSSSDLSELLQNNSITYLLPIITIYIQPYNHWTSDSFTYVNSEKIIDRNDFTLCI